MGIMAHAPGTAKAEATEERTRNRVWLLALDCDDNVRDSLTMRIWVVETVVIDPEMCVQEPLLEEVLLSVKF